MSLKYLAGIGLLAASLPLYAQQNPEKPSAELRRLATSYVEQLRHPRETSFGTLISESADFSVKFEIKLVKGNKIVTAFEGTTGQNTSFDITDDEYFTQEGRIREGSDGTRRVFSYDNNGDIDSCDIDVRIPARTRAVLDGSIDLSNDTISPIDTCNHYATEPVNALLAALREYGRSKK